MRLIFKRFFICTISFYPLLAIGTQFLVLPVGAMELALGSHPAFGGSATINPALIQAPQARAIQAFATGCLGDLNQAVADVVFVADPGFGPVADADQVDAGEIVDGDGKDQKRRQLMRGKERGLGVGLA